MVLWIELQRPMQGPTDWWTVSASATAIARPNGSAPTVIVFKRSSGMQIATAESCAKWTNSMMSGLTIQSRD